MCALLLSLGLLSPGLALLCFSWSFRPRYISRDHHVLSPLLMIFSQTPIITPVSLAVQCRETQDLDFLDRTMAVRNVVLSPGGIILEYVLEGSEGAVVWLLPHRQQWVSRNCNRPTRELLKLFLC